MQFFSELRNDYRFGAAFEGLTKPDDGILAGATIDAWESDCCDEEGCVLATIILSTHGDIIVVYHDNSVRLHPLVLEKIEEVKEEFNALWKQLSISEV